MKHIFTTIIVFLGLNLCAQTPQAIKYQAVARDGAGNVLANTAVSFRISILQTSVNGSVKYSETHSKTTNTFGLVDLEIGHGTPVSGSFAGINWGSDDYFMKVEMDPNGGSAYQVMGTSQLLSVPYALYARDVQNNNDADADPANELQKISISGTVLTLDKSGGSVTLPSSGGGDNWGTQTVATDASLSGNGTSSTPLKVADNGVDSSKIADGSIASADIANSAITADKINSGAVTGAKIAQASATTGQALKWNGTTWSPANDETGSGGTIPTGPAGGDLTGSYPDPTIATGKVTSAKILDGTISTADLADNAVTSAKITDGAVATADLADNAVTSAKIADATIVNADIANNAVSSTKILDGTIATADLASSAVTSDKLTANAVITDKITSGAVTGTKIAQAGAITGQALKWDGTTWAPANDETGSGGTTPTGTARGDLTGSYPDPTIATGKVTSAKILDGTITTADLADNTVTSAKIADATIVNADIANNAVSSAKILDGTIATGDLAVSAVTTDKLSTSAVTSDKLSSSAVTADKITTGAVTGTKIAQAGATSGQALKWNGTTWAPANDETGSGGTTPTGPAGGDLTGSYPDPTIATGKVTSAKILDGTIATADLADNTVTSAKIADATIVNADIANNAVSSAKILDGTIVTADLASSAVTSDKLTANAVITDKITSGAVTGTKIAQAGATSGQALKWNGTTWAPANDETGSGGTTPTGPAGGDLTGSYPDPTIATGKVTSAKILDGTIATADLADNTVTSAKIADATIVNADIANNAVSSAKILDGTIVTADLASSAVTSDKLTANAVITDKITSGAVTGTKIAQAGATSGQALKWDGTTWAPANDETGSGGTTPTGPAGGDLTGSYPDPTIATGKVTSAKILDGTIATADLADNAVTSAKITDGAVATADLADNAVTSAKIADATIVNADIANNAVSSAKILDGTITTADLTSSAVTSDKLAASAVSTDKITSGAVTGTKIAQAGATSGQALKWDGTTWAPANDETGSGGTTPTGPAGGDLTGSYPDPTIATGKVTSAKILDGTIATADLADNTVTSAKITDGAIATADLADNAVTSAKIVDATIVSADLANNAVTTDKINPGAVTGAKIAQAGATSGQALKWNGTTWAPANDETGSGGTTPTGPAGGDLTGSYPDPTIATGKVTSAKILDGTIATSDLGDNTVISAKIADSTIESGDLASNSVTSEKIAENAVTVAKLPTGAASDKFLRGDGTWAIPTVGSVTEFDPTWNGPANLDGDIGRMGNVGIGTVSPTALLHTNGTGTGGGNVLFEGEYKIYFPGAPPVEGAGTRMMWYPDQAVFRMGAVSDDRWDAANLGTFSTAIGYNCVASGDVSFSLGSYTTAANTCAIAIGHGTQAWAYASTAMGYSTTAYGYASTAFGDNTVAQAYVSTAIGQYNVGNGTKNTWEETEPIFEIGIGRSHLTRKNAMTVLKNGYVGIGKLNPEASLHIAGDGWPHSFVYLEAAAGNDAGMRFYESTTPKWHIFNDASVGGLMIQNNATTPAIYCNQSNAYVGIRTSSPTQALHVVGDAYKTSGGTSWATSSDLRLKYITGKYTKGLNEIAALQPVKFVYKENNPRQLTADIEQVGFVAQEVQKIFPESVTEAADGYLDFNIHAINVALVNAVKELKIENDLLKARLEKLELLLPVGSLK